MRRVTVRGQTKQVRCCGLQKTGCLLWKPV